jgi:DNA polymerase-3 subunit delta'
MTARAGVIGHEGVLRELRGLASARPPAHAILLAGPESTGRMTLAREYARLLNCEGAGETMAGFESPEFPCGTCRACHLIAEGTHPDVVVLGPGDVLCRPGGGESSHAAHPDSRDIRICQVRGVIDMESRYPFEARYRVVIIDPAERITPTAGNSLLKTLEEPSPHTVFVLVAAAPDDMLETVISRCRRIDVSTVPASVIEEGLRERGVDGATAHEAAVAARGRPGLAIRFAGKPDLMGDRARILQRCARIAAAPLTERFRYTEELQRRWRTDRAPIFRELQVWEEFWEAALSAAAKSGDREAARDAATALRAVATAREYLLANVLARTVFDFLLVNFPHRRLDEGGADAAGV